MDKETQLLRQVHPSFVQGDTISTQVFTSQVFAPTPKDDNKLSTYNGNKFSPVDSHVHYSELGYVSSGVVSVTVEECESESLSTEEDNDPFDGHCSIDFNDLSTNGVKTKAKKLKKHASTRGWLHKS
ncbi:hypothetical protein [Croceimicrobium sp.]|uniref:hypothetical protein n=1 Tax=Croceimicrobium sp. TaxID=2828340 RepID=UPI003BAA05CD